MFSEHISKPRVKTLWLACTLASATHRNRFSATSLKRLWWWINLSVIDAKTWSCVRRIGAVRCAAIALRSFIHRKRVRLVTAESRFKTWETRTSNKVLTKSSSTSSLNPRWDCAIASQSILLKTSARFNQASQARSRFCRRLLALPVPTMNSSSRSRRENQVHHFTHTIAYLWSQTTMASRRMKKNKLFERHKPPWTTWNPLEVKTFLEIEKKLFKNWLIDFLTFISQ